MIAPDRNIQSGNTKRVLVVEDQVLLAAFLKDLLEAAGFTVCGPHATAEAAIKAIERNAPFAAILDVCLSHTDTSLPVARQLQKIACPFAFASGFSETEHPVIDQFPGTPCFEKPFSNTVLIAWLNQLNQ